MTMLEVALMLLQLFAVVAVDNEATEQMMSAVRTLAETMVRVL
jgi:hypothetical protein